MDGSLDASALSGYRIVSLFALKSDTIARKRLETKLQLMISERWSFDSISQQITSAGRSSIVAELVIFRSDHLSFRILVRWICKFATDLPLILFTQVNKTDRELDGAKLETAVFSYSWIEKFSVNFHVKILNLLKVSTWIFKESGSGFLDIKNLKFLWENFWKFKKLPIESKLLNWELLFSIEKNFKAGAFGGKIINKNEMKTNRVDI